MEGLRFEWDPHKSAANRQKHGVSFEEAKTVFYDEEARVIADPDHSSEEDRFIIMGLSHSTRVLVVVHSYRQNDALIRLISARKATQSEERQYWRNKS
jgi:uncharacterized DUF497 family protein